MRQAYYLRELGDIKEPYEILTRYEESGLSVICTTSELEADKCTNSDCLTNGHKKRNIIVRIPKVIVKFSTTQTNDI